jgi:hypothetical protein
MAVAGDGRAAESPSQASALLSIARDCEQDTWQLCAPAPIGPAAPSGIPTPRTAGSVPFLPLLTPR